MKKIFSFTFALFLVVSASGMVLPNVNRMQPEQKNNRFVYEQTEQVNLPASEAQMPAMDKPYKLGHLNNAATKPIRRMVNAEADTVTIQSGGAMYLKEYFEYYGYDYGHVWDFTFDGTNSTWAHIQFVGLSSKRIAAIYHNVYADICVTPGDTVATTGTLKIEYVKDGEEGGSPVYAFDGLFVDDAGKEYVINGEYSFGQYDVINLYYYYQYYNYCESFGIGCNYIFLTLTDTKIEPEDQEDIVITNSASKSYYGNEGAWYISAKDSNYFASLQVYTDSLGGNFTTEDLDFAYTRITAFIGNDTTSIETYKPVSATITDTEDTIFFNFSLIGVDAIQYNVSMFFAKPVISDTITSVITEGILYDYTEEGGVIMFQGYNDTIQISGAVYADSLRGVFTERDTYSGGYYDYIVRYESKEDTIGKIYAADNYKFALDTFPGYPGYYAINMFFNGYNPSDRSDAHCFHIVLLVKLFDAYEYDVPVDTTFTFTAKRENVFNTSLFEQYGALMINALDSVNKVQFASIVWVDELDETYILPLDVYDIDDSNEAPSVLASTGISEDYATNYPTYLRMVIGQYNYYWYLVGGTLTAEADKITVDAVNSKGNSVKITINFIASGIDEIATDAIKANKIMKDGNIYILRNNNIYNMLGTCLK